jgi:ATP-dependent Clp protease adaptor protein ClpS
LAGAALHRCGGRTGNYIPTVRHGTVNPIRSQTLPQHLPQSETELKVEGLWRVVVLNDPVNLMSYVVLVFKKVFALDEQSARKHMLEVHEQGRSVVWCGLREKAEAHVFTLHQWHLSAVLEPDEAH